MSDGEKAYLRFVIKMCVANMDAGDFDSVVKLMTRYVNEYKKRGIEND